MRTPRIGDGARGTLQIRDVKPGCRLGGSGGNVSKMSGRVNRDSGRETDPAARRASLLRVKQNRYFPHVAARQNASDYAGGAS
jgi:hypothetical protein